MNFKIFIRDRISSVLVIAALALILFPLSAVETTAADIEKSESIYIDANLTKELYQNASDSFFGKIDWDQKINIFDSEIDLLPEYVSPVESFKTAYAYAFDLLQQLQCDFDLDDFTEDTWEDYQTVMLRFEFDESSKYDRMMIGKMMQFFDFYENTAINNDIRKTVHENKLDSGIYINSADKDLDMDLFGRLPIYSRIGELEKIRNATTAIRTGVSNLTNAINYASRYATTNNPSYSYYSGKDCTNFASQIRNSSGIPQTSSWKPYTVSWINADSFARSVVGVRNVTPNHRTFASLCNAGDFIAFDKGRDGSFDHIGFVTANNSQEGIYGGITYRNYRVAQHSSDYHDWTSSSVNGWETGEDMGYWYAELN